VVLVASLSVVNPQAGEMSAESVNPYRENMSYLVNMTSGCHPAESYTEHFENKEQAREALEQLNVEKPDEGLAMFSAETLYCGRKSN
jgi:hypothetical protein